MDAKVFVYNILMGKKIDDLGKSFMATFCYSDSAGVRKNKTFIKRKETRIKVLLVSPFHFQAKIQ